MEIVTSADFQRNLGQYQDRALVEPIVVTRNGRERIVLLSVAEYNRLRSLDRQTFSAEDLPRSVLQDILHSDIPAEAKRFDQDDDE